MNIADDRNKIIDTDVAIGMKRNKKLIADGLYSRPPNEITGEKKKWNGTRVVVGVGGPRPFGAVHFGLVGQCPAVIRAGNNWRLPALQRCVSAVCLCVTGRSMSSALATPQTAAFNQLL